VIDSIKRQCEGLVAADKWGGELRARNLKALEAGEQQIDADFTDSRRKLVQNAMAGTAESAVTRPRRPRPTSSVSWESSSHPPDLQDRPPCRAVVPPQELRCASVQMGTRKAPKPAFPLVRGL
jgi:hypothetical protein